MANHRDRTRVRPIDRVLKWAGEQSLADVARALHISPQRLNNWIERGMPPREHARVAAHYGRSVEVLVGLADDDPILAELLTFWDVMLPESKLEVLRHAKYVRTIQNPAPDPQRTKR